MNQIEGDLIATDLKIAFVVSRFNEFVCERLLEGALDSFARHGGNKDEVTVLRVPGAFELPLAAKKMLRVENLMLSSAWELLFAERHHITIMYVQMHQAVLLLPHWKPEFLSALAL